MKVYNPPFFTKTPKQPKIQEKTTLCMPFATIVSRLFLNSIDCVDGSAGGGWNTPPGSRGQPGTAPGFTMRHHA